MTNTTNPFVPVKSAEMDWNDDGQGFHSKLLHTTPEAGRRTVLIKVEPGAFYEAHSHDYFEQMYVIEGSFYDQTNTYNAGDFVTRDAGADHIAGSHTGALVLVWQSQ